MFADLVGEAWAWILSPVVREASVARADKGNIKIVGDLYLSWGVLFAFSLFLPQPPLSQATREIGMYS